MEAFVGPPPEGMINPEVNHKNGVITDNRLENLEWLSHEDNCQHAHDTGLNPSSKEVSCYDLSGNLLEKYKSMKSAAVATKVIATSVADSCNLGFVVDRKYIFRHGDSPIPDDVLEKAAGMIAKDTSRIAQYSISGELVKIWGSAPEIRKVAGVAKSSLNRCLKGTQRTALNSIWKRYAEGEDIPSVLDKTADFVAPKAQPT